MQSNALLPLDGRFRDTTVMSDAEVTQCNVRSPHENPLAGIRLGERNSNHEKVVSVLSEAKMPMDVENVRVKTGLKNWESTKSILLELVLQGAILGQKTTRGWIFWATTLPREKSGF